MTDATRATNDVTAALADAAGGMTRPVQIDTLRLQLPAGATRTEIARALRQALDAAAGDDR